MKPFQRSLSLACRLVAASRETRPVMKRYWALMLGAGVIAAIGLAAGLDEVEGAFGQWRVAGQNLANTRSAAGEKQISPANVASLAAKWTFTTGGDVSATPTVAGDAVYVPDWAGNVYAIDRNTGTQIWSVQVPALDGVAGAVSRSSPAVHGDDVIIGDIENDGATALHNGANLIALNRKTGKVHWMTQVDNQGAAIITGSPVVSDTPSMSASRRTRKSSPFPTLTHAACFAAVWWP